MLLPLLALLSVSASEPIQPRQCATVKYYSLAQLRAASDCSGFATTIKSEYALTNQILQIPVVFHIITTNSGTGNVSDELVKSQIEILNEDYLAKPNTPGEPGNSVGVRFVLATVDPSGKPTTGITRHTSSSWFYDPGPEATNPMKNALAWDTERYLNIYTNDASGALGYATFPDDNAGKEDGVVLLWRSVGRNAPQGGEYNQGRTATHEVGHYLGLLHTFSGGTCSNTYTSGDLLKDTPPQLYPQGGCPSGSETAMCGGNADPTNYMDYTYDTCMFHFTLEQVNRMRCSLLNYRQVLIDNSVCGDGVVGLSEVCDDRNTTSGDGCSSNCQSDETCGNKLVDVGEACDDGNTKNGDGCRADCGGTEVCGDGLVDTAKKEVCDDGNTDAGDGCSADCQSKEVCGDGMIDDARGEVCDDYNTEDGDGCSRDCKSDETCGNDIVDADEACDGGSDCDSKCQKKKKAAVEPKPVATQVEATPATPAGGCGGCQNGGTPWLAAFVALALLRRKLGQSRIKLQR
jgi:cysteine-rich repeat protein